MNQMTWCQWNSASGWVLGDVLKGKNDIGDMSDPF